MKTPYQRQVDLHMPELLAVLENLLDILVVVFIPINWFLAALAWVGGKFITYKRTQIKPVISVVESM